MCDLVGVRMMLFLSLLPQQRYLQLANCGLSNLTGAHWSDHCRCRYMGSGLGDTSLSFFKYIHTSAVFDVRESEDGLHHVKHSHKLYCDHYQRPLRMHHFHKICHSHLHDFDVLKTLEPPTNLLSIKTCKATSYMNVVDWYSS
jgi:hypothetical protein